MPHYTALIKKHRFIHPQYNRPVNFPVHLIVTPEGIYFSALDISLCTGIKDPTATVQQCCRSPWRCTDDEALLKDLFHEGDGRLKGLTMLHVSDVYALLSQTPGLDPDRVREFRAWMSETIKQIQKQ